jgi:cytoskeletal protein CcmA (bactofilin family)
MTQSPLRRIRDKAGSAATLINEGCKIVGTITGSGSYLVNGEVEGDCELDATLTLAHNGIWKGTIRATNVIIAGQVEGDIIAEGSVEITDSARIVGTVTGEAIAVAEGAVVDGVMKTSGPAEPLEFVEKRHID